MKIDNTIAERNRKKNTDKVVRKTPHKRKTITIES